MQWDILGHEWAVNLLQNQLLTNNLRHAYLFTGPTGVGRRTLALRFAQAINCTNPPAPAVPCGSCRDCTQLARMEHPDLNVVEIEADRTQVRIEQVRAVQRTLSLAPYQARYRIALFLRFEDANPSAANALLKTLEEPGQQVVLLLTAESPERLLPTITSRCEVLRLRPMRPAELTDAITKRWGIQGEDALNLAYLSEGRPGRAFQLSQDADARDQRTVRLDDLQMLLHADRAARFAYAESAAKDKDRFRETVVTWLSLWRDILLKASGSAAVPVNRDRQAEIESITARIDLAASLKAVRSLDQTLDHLNQNVNTRLAAEVLLLDFPFLG